MSSSLAESSVHSDPPPGAGWAADPTGDSYIPAVFPKTQLTVFAFFCSTRIGVTISPSGLPTPQRQAKVLPSGRPCPCLCPHS